MTTKTHRVAHGQGFYDIAIISTGIADNATAIALANGATTSDTVTPGSSVAIPADLPTDTRTANFFRAHPHPATAADTWAEGAPATYGGIGRMSIGNNFAITASIQ